MRAIQFWSFDFRGCEINYSKLIEFLSEAGFVKVINPLAKDAPAKFAVIENNIVEERLPEEIYEYVQLFILQRNFNSDFLPDNQRDLLINELNRSINVFQRKALYLLPTLEDSFVKDTKCKCHFFFMNCFVSVSKDGINTHEYKDLNGLIWKSQIIKRIFNLVSWDEIKKESHFLSFMENITRDEVEDKWVINESKLFHLISILGFLVHSYKDYSNPRAVVLSDYNSNSQLAFGGTGKGIIRQALGQVRKVESEDGRSFKNEDNFKFEKITRATNLLFIEDVSKDFRISSLFSAITEGIVINKKYESRYLIPFSDSPKIVITSNYTYPTLSTSYRRRVYEFELANYYSDRHQPIDDFKYNFFDEDWPSKQWKYFDNLMVYASEYYFKNSVVEEIDPHIFQKKLISVGIPSDLTEWLMNLPFKPGVKHFKEELLSNFKSSFTEYEMDQASLTKIIKQYLNFKGIRFIENHTGDKKYFLIL